MYTEKGESMRNLIYEMLMMRFYTIRCTVLYYTHDDSDYDMSCYCFRRLKLECEKLATEKTEMQRHYVMVS